MNKTLKDDISRLLLWLKAPHLNRMHINSIKLQPLSFVQIIQFCLSWSETSERQQAKVIFAKTAGNKSNYAKVMLFTTNISGFIYLHSLNFFSISCSMASV